MGLALMVTATALLLADARHDRDLFDKGRAALDAGDCRAAVNAFESVQAQNDKALLFHLAKAHQCAGDTAKALSYYRQYDQLVPNVPAVRRAIGELEYRLDVEGQTAAAAQAAQAQRARQAAADAAKRSNLVGRWHTGRLVIDILSDGSGGYSTSTVRPDIRARGVGEPVFECPSNCQTSAYTHDVIVHVYHAAYEEWRDGIGGISLSLEEGHDKCPGLGWGTQENGKMEVSEDGSRITLTYPRREVYIDRSGTCSRNFSSNATVTFQRE